MKQQFERLRLGLILALLGSVLAVLSKTSFYPNQKRTNIPTVTLPITLNLQNWQWKSSQALYADKPDFQNGRSYRYEKNGSAIDIEIFYLASTKGNIEDYLKLYKSLELSRAPIVRQHEKIGFYGVFAEGSRSYLSACLNPRGQSTFSGIQFARNRNMLDMTPDRILPWIIGQSELRDDRCLWVTFSMPTKDNPESTYQELEQLWFSLYSDLQTRFSQI